MSAHIFHLNQAPPQKSDECGVRIKAAKSDFPALQGMSFAKLILHPLSIREPHWHANADELGYCLKGKALISLYGTGNEKQTFLVEPGQAFFIPSGTLHDIENVGDSTAEIIISFSHEEPEDFSLSSMFGMFSDAVLGNTWGLSHFVFQSLKRSTKDILITKRKLPAKVTKDANYSSPHRFNLEASSPLITNDGGLAKVARQNVWPILKHQALYSLKLTGEGMREPHWHPETAELGFVSHGKGRMSILFPSGHLETYQMNEGDIYFIPKAYPHHIENLANDDFLQIMIFFDTAMPSDIGLTASVKSYSNDTLNAIFNSSDDLFEKLPTYYEDLFIVKKINPLDP